VPSDRQQTFLSLVRANDARLRRICRVYARDDDARKDLHQEILFQLWRSLPSFAGAASPDTWLYRVALNTALTHARRHPARRETPLDGNVLDAAESERAIDVAASVDDDDRLARLHEAIDRLGVVDKMLVTMYLDERSYREMADVLGISESNVGVKLHRVKKALAKWLAEETV
jgi:RNA polymerase sigma-70 factor, ECF subfamily